MREADEKSTRLRRRRPVRPTTAMVELRPTAAEVLDASQRRCWRRRRQMLLTTAAGMHGAMQQEGLRGGGDRRNTRPVGRRRVAPYVVCQIRWPRRRGRLGAHVSLRIGSTYCGHSARPTCAATGGARVAWADSAAHAHSSLSPSPQPPRNSQPNPFPVPLLAPRHRRRVSGYLFRVRYQEWRAAENGGAWPALSFAELRSSFARMLSSSCSVAACGARWFQHLFVAAVRLPMLLCCEAVLWATTFLTFPVRLLAAADRERKLGEMQGQMERVVWENSDLEKRLRAALKENAAMEDILDEMDEEHEVAFARIKSLESQLKALKKENMRLKEQRGKYMCDTVAVAGSGGGKKKAGEPVAWETPAGKGQEDEEYAAAQKDQSLVYRSGGLDAIPASEAQARLLRATARRQSLFSVGMSLAVGGIAWSADAPCLPLLAGLVAVVTMSMCSVSRLLRAPADRRVPPPASAASEGAVALLSLNWFLLGVLTYPMLPGVARAVVPPAARLTGPVIAWLAAAGPV